MDQSTLSPAMIEARAISKHFNTEAGRVDLFTDLDVTIARGESLAVIGRSGAGKSTLLSLLAGLDTPSSGRVSIDGQAIETLDDRQRAELRARKISFIFQSFHLLPELTALDNVRLPLEIRGAADPERDARHWLSEVGLADRTDHYPAQLSGGEQQRVAIARAFATRPGLLFADEPTGNLDEDTGAHIIDQLFRLNAQEGTTLILITHDAELAARCQRRLRLHNGTLTEA
ncbi:ABC transporter, ATP-binding protein [Marinobacterium lacunae]|uniref:ABC transporter, ATP-binding protein n=1 Tax=Marinobacterium lacunae TaxID=1232683 RepID=A0A081FY99_9GAMM|nr:ABC transporter ATP-binding protein [Marinobacterium lacunae]KEA63504.1 ABC transporter, ATP-binding protein [Marinobacterium lacunae]MBR9883947.1 ABC transporter ATP-binding protein [Oceanospirillales bacterium]